jgi:deoxyribodipyrimidine photolyase-related protein
LLDVDPQQLSDWFWVAYIDAFDWVVEPNVLGMGTFSLGPLMTTKPYVSGANYLHKMSDYCADCAFKPRTTCPITSMYWDFLRRHRETLGELHRLRLPLASQAKRSPDKQAHDRAVAARVMEVLAAGDRLAPKDLADL